MSNDQPNFPANVVVYMRQLIDRRTTYKKELEQLPKPPAFKLVAVDRYQAECERLQASIKLLTDNVVDITRRHFPTIEVSTASQEITIANILAVLPPPEEVIVKKLFHGGQ